MSTPRRGAEAPGQAAAENSAFDCPLLFERNPIPMWIFDEATLRFLAVNAAATKLYGWSRGEFLRMSINDIRPPEEVREPAKGLAVTRNSRTAFVGEWCHWKKDHTRLDVEVSVSDIQFQGRDARLVMVNDVTVRKRTEEVLRLNEQRLQAELDAAKRLAGLGTLLIQEGELQPVLAAVVDAAIAISGADFGNIQLLDTASGDLKIVAQRGFPKGWIELWDRVSAGRGVGGTALARGQRVVVEDVERSRIFAGTPALEMQRKAGVRAVQSTPLVSRSGKVVGMFSTHYRTPQRPAERTLPWLDLLARQAADLIERAQAGAALRASEERFRAAQETSLDAFTTLDAVRDRRGTIVDFRWTYVNPAAARILRHPPVQLVGSRLLEVLPGNRANCDLFRRYVRVVQTGKPHDYEVRYRAEGIDGWFRNMAVKLGDGVAVLFADITDRKRAEEGLRRLTATLERRVAARTQALQASEERFRGLYSQAAIGIAIADWQGRIQHCNAAFGRITGLNEHELRQKRLVDLVHPADRTKARALGRLLRRGEIPACALEHRFITKSGETTWGHSQLSPLRDRRGRRTHLMALVEDITARHQALEAVRRSEANMVAFFTNAPIGLLWVDAAGRVQRVNEAQLAVFDLPRDKVLGQFMAALDPGGELAAVLTRLRACDEPVRNYGAQFRRRDGSVVHVLIDAVGVREDGRLVRSEWFVRDITRRVMLERELLEAGERERRQIGNELHDDLGQLLYGVSFIAEALTKRLRQRGLAEAAEMRRLTSVLAEALATTRSLARGLQPVPALPEGLMSALRGHATRVQEIHGIRCRFVCRRPVLVADRAVATHLFRIAQEAVTNACKHARCRRIVIGLQVKAQRLVLVVRDDGHGRPPPTTQPRGMGLQVMRFRANSINGRLSVRHRPGRGTEVACSIERPAAETRANGAPPTSESIS